jgi:hypothetical protein
MFSKNKIKNMKTVSASILIILGLCIGFFAAHWSVAQTLSQSSSKEPITAYNNIALDQLTLLLSNLNETKQTNALKLFNDYANASLAQQKNAEMGMKLHILYSLRAGRTNEVINLLEQEMTGDVVGFVASYRNLSASQSAELNLAALKKARDYCDKFQVKSGHPDVDEIVSNSFKLLDEKATK